MINVGFLINTMYGGGAERIVLNLLQKFDRNTFKLNLILSDVSGHYIDQVPADVNIIKIENSLDIRSVWQFSKEIKDVVESNEIQILNCHLTRNNISVLRANWLRKIGIPILISEHNNFSAKTKNMTFLYEFLFNIQVSYLYKQANRIITSSSGIKHNLLNDLNICKSKFQVVYNPVDLEFINESIRQDPLHIIEKDYFNLIAVGRLVEQKGFDILIKAVSILFKNDKNVKLYILGEGEEKSSLIKLANDLGIKDRVIFTGFLKNPWVEIKQADLFVLSSRWEGFGNVIIEAMASGTAVISTDCDYGPSEIIQNGYNGMLINNINEEELASGIIEIMNSKKVREKYLRNSIKMIKKFNIDNFIKEYENTIELLFHQ